MKYLAHFFVAVAISLIASDAVAEVSDKVLSIPTLWGASLALTVIAVLLGMLRPWAALIPGLLGLAFFGSFLDTVQDPAPLVPIRGNRVGPISGNQVVPIRGNSAMRHQ